MLDAAEDAAFDVEADEYTLVETLLEGLAEDLVEVENVTIEEIIMLDAEDTVGSTALLGAEYDIDGVACEDRDIPVDRGHSQLLCVGVACASVVCGEGGIVAVSGPNCLIR